jgi:hypothetical protein
MALIVCSAFSAEMRVWEDKSGNPVKAEFERELFGSVELRRPDGSLYSIPLENLSELDRKYIRTQIPPEIELEVRTQKRAKERNPNTTRAAYEQFRDDINVVTANVEIRQKSQAVFTGTLRAEVYLIGEEVATPDIYRLAGKEAAQVQFTEQNKKRFKFETSADFRVYEEYNYDMRGAEYAGYLVVLLDPMGNIMKTDTDLSWLEDSEIDDLRKFYVDSFFDEDCRKRSVPRPRYYTGRREF